MTNDSLRAPIHLLAGGPGNDRRHLVDLLRQALPTTPVRPPHVAYIGAASGDDAGFFRRMSALLREAGAAEVVLVPTFGAGAAARFRDAISSAGVVFVSGGDVAAGMAALEAIDAPPLLRARHEAGVPFIGLSAGSIMLVRAWIAWRDPEDDATAEVFPCLGLAPLLCDTHAEEDDWTELRALLSRQPAGTVGYGITMPAMLRGHADGRIEAVGGDLHRLQHTLTGVVRTA